MSKTKAIDIDELRDESRNESKDDFREKTILVESDANRECSRLDEVARAVEALERRVKALEEEASEKMNEPS